MLNILLLSCSVSLSQSLHFSGCNFQYNSCLFLTLVENISSLNEKNSNYFTLFRDYLMFCKCILTSNTSIFFWHDINFNSSCIFRTKTLNSVCDITFFKHFICILLTAIRNWLSFFLPVVIFLMYFFFFPFFFYIFS